MFERSDEALYRRLVNGDVTAFDALYERHGRHLFGFVRCQLGGADADAEDVVHEAFLAVLRERGAGRSARSFQAWLFQVARHLCLNRARSRSRATKAFDEVGRGVDSVSPPAEHALVAEQQSVGLRVAVEKLPASLGELYHLRAGGMSYQELATELGIPLGTVKSRMHELVSRLKQELDA